MNRLDYRFDPSRRSLRCVRDCGDAVGLSYPLPPDLRLRRADTGRTRARRSRAKRAWTFRTCTGSRSARGWRSRRRSGTRSTRSRCRVWPGPARPKARRQGAMSAKRCCATSGKARAPTRRTQHAWLHCMSGSSRAAIPPAPRRSRPCARPRRGAGLGRLGFPRSCRRQLSGLRGSRWPLLPALRAVFDARMAARGRGGTGIAGADAGSRRKKAPLSRAGPSRRSGYPVSVLRAASGSAHARPDPACPCAAGRSAG